MLFIPIIQNKILVDNLRANNYEMGDRNNSYDSSIENINYLMGSYPKSDKDKYYEYRYIYNYRYIIFSENDTKYSTIEYDGNKFVYSVLGNTGYILCELNKKNDQYQLRNFSHEVCHKYMPDEETLENITTEYQKMLNVLNN